MSGNKVEIAFPEDRASVIEYALREADDCVSVGGLAHRVGRLQGEKRAPRVFGKFIELARRNRGWTSEQLCEFASIELSELVSIESDRNFIPRVTTVTQLASTLGYPPEQLIELAGLTREQSGRLAAAALRFAARSEPTAKLNDEERNAFEAFVKDLVTSAAKE